MLTGMLRVRQWHNAAFKCSSDDPTSHVWKLFFRLLVRSSSSGQNVVPTWMPKCCFAYYHLELLNEGNRWCKSWNIFNKYALSLYTLLPAFTLIRHASASYYVNSTTPVPKLSPTFWAVSLTWGHVHVKFSQLETCFSDYSDTTWTHC